MATVQVHHHQKHRQKQKQIEVELAPEEFIEDCKALTPDFEKNRSKVNKIYKKWITKGKNPKLIGSWLRPILKQWYSASSVSEMLPKDARRDYQKSGHYSKNTGKPRAPKFKETLNSSTSSTQESQKETEKVGALRTEPIKTHTTGKPGIINQAADDYNIDELDEYDNEYLKLIVRWLHKLRMDFINEAFKWQTKFDDMRRENKLLTQRLEEHGIKI